ncbi:MAG: hypothetical protein ABFS43_12105 [Thermodesulfobacteriota bacterium]
MIKPIAMAIGFKFSVPLKEQNLSDDIIVAHDKRVTMLDHQEISHFLKPGALHRDFTVVYFLVGPGGLFADILFFHRDVGEKEGHAYRSQ